MLLSAILATALLWEPLGIQSDPSLTTPVLIAALEAGRRGSGAQVSETFHVVTPDGAFDASAKLRGTDYRVDIVLDDATYKFGRTGGQSWLSSPSGSVRILRSDVQGDLLDRWPRTILGFNPNGCSAMGTTELRGATLGVLDCRVSEDFEHWYEADPKSGRIMREISREGSRVITYDFDDFRETDGITQAFHWKVSGADGDADVSVTSVQLGSVTSADLAIPATVPTQYHLPASGISLIPAEFKNHNVLVPVEIGGQTQMFSLDTGTSQTVIDVGAAKRVGLHPEFKRAIVPELHVGDLTAANLPIAAMDIFHGKLAGILGNDFFTGHVVRIDYKDEKLEVISHETFEPPADAFPLKIRVDEGIPIGAAVIDGVRGDRFALDTGSYYLLVRSQLGEAAHLPRYPRDRHFQFLEGPFSVQSTLIQSFEFGSFKGGPVDAVIETPTRDNTDFPLDGIVGTEVLGIYDLWFDYDNGVVWMR
jgi:hypothetical protein